MRNITGKGIVERVYFYFNNWGYFYFSAGYFFCKKFHIPIADEHDKSKINLTPAYV